MFVPRVEQLILSSKRLKCNGCMQGSHLVLLCLAHRWASRQPFSTCLRKSSSLSSAICVLCFALLLQVTKRPATLALDAQHAQPREQSSTDPTHGPSCFWEGCVVLDVVCGDLAFPMSVVSWWGQHSWHLLLHFTFSFCLAYRLLIIRGLQFSLHTHLPVFHCVTLRWTGSSCSFNK